MHPHPLQGSVVAQSSWVPAQEKVRSWQPSHCLLSFLKLTASLPQHAEKAHVACGAPQVAETHAEPAEARFAALHAQLADLLPAGVQAQLAEETQLAVSLAWPSASAFWPFWLQLGLWRTLPLLAAAC